MARDRQPRPQLIVAALLLGVALLAGCPAASPAPADTARGEARCCGVGEAGVLDQRARDAWRERALLTPDTSGVADAARFCPPEMALVAETFCVDRYEAALEEQTAGSWAPASPFLTVGSRVVRAVPAKGITPQGYISGAEAARACVAAGKRLCTGTEWLAACRGPSLTTWPYGGTYQSGACNDAYAGHPVVKFFGTSVGVWDAVHMNDPGINQQPGTVAAGGATTACVSAWGVQDLHGNLHEWVDDPAGTFRGGFYADAKLNGQGCLYVTTAHAFDYHDYSTGFRCCAARR